MYKNRFGPQSNQSRAPAKTRADKSSPSVVIIDHNKPFVEFLVQRFKGLGYNSQPVIGATSDEILNALAKVAGIRAIFINIHLRLSDREKLQSCKGIDLAKHIRLTQSLSDDLRRCPMVIYSFFRIWVLLKTDPRNVFLTSPGISVIDATQVIHLELRNHELHIGKFKSKVTPLRSLSLLTPYLKLDMSEAITLEKHKIANWWGPSRLLVGHKIFVNDPQSLDIQYAGKQLQDKFKTRSEDVSSKEIMFINEQSIKIGSNEREHQIVSYHDGVQGISDTLNKMVLAKQPGVTERDNLKTLIDNLCSTNGIPGVQKKFKGVLYIDDEIDNGWLDVLHMLLGESYVKAIKSFDEASEAVRYTNLREYLLVLLDLRLQGETQNRYSNIMDFSGAKLLKLIKDPKRGDPSMPVIIFTASSRIEILEQLTELGADGFWSKEGLLNSPDDAYSFRNYLKLRRLIYEALGQVRLRLVWDKIKSLEQRTIDADTMAYLYDAFSFLRMRKKVWNSVSISNETNFGESILHSYLAAENHCKELVKNLPWEEPSVVPGIIEGGFKNMVTALSNRNVINLSHENALMALSNLRNTVAHSSSETTATFENAINSINHVITFLLAKG
ncbi:MAG TPA: response regulator [Candidatus Acidoferrales bacterium]|nr:response regulator [Candidatus Acidoferrales bacterium]